MLPQIVLVECPLTDSDHVRKVDYINEALSYDDGETPQHSINSSSYGYDTNNLKSLRYYTREALPKADHYRNVLSVHGYADRPTLDQLHRASIVSNELKKSIDVKQPGAEAEKIITGVKFGWIQGVFIRCLLNIWGVMLFLRLSWVVGQAGIGLGCLIILMASVVTTITTLSMSAICTNGEVKGGGTYYMISRSLGPEFGGSIGLIFSLANAVSVSMYAVGFAETVRDILKEYKLQMFDGGVNDVRIIAAITAVVMVSIVLIGTEWESKTQMVLLVILVAAMVNFFAGAFIAPTPDKRARGFEGWNKEIFEENVKPDFRGGETFFSVFSVFFPAATGISAGANISGDLKDPQKAIPRGTLLAILVSTISYILFAITSGSTVHRDATGIENDTYLDFWSVRNCSLTSDGVCRYGISNSVQAIQMAAAYTPLIYAGIFAASLSSALASMVSAPKVFQALCNDKLFPYIHWFGKPYGKNGEPRRAYILAFLIAVSCCAIGDLNNIAPVISNFFLAAYALMNFSCFHASFARSPGFRPAFKFYNMWLSLLGAILSLAVMFIVEWKMALGTFALVLALYIFISYRKPDVNWGSSTQAQTYLDALNSVIKLNHVEDHVKNYRPQVLILTGNPSSRPTLVDFASYITKKDSLLLCGHILEQSQGHRFRETMNRRATHWLQKRKVKAFYCLAEEEESFSRGVHSLLQLVGVGKLRPNTLLFGFKMDWQTCDRKDMAEYFRVIHVAFDLQMSVMILRLPEGLDYSSYGDYEELKFLMSKHKGKMLREGEHHESSSADSTPNSSPVISRSNNNLSVPSPPAARIMRGLSKDVPREVLTSVNRFQKKQREGGTIDVWWLYDDGGLTMLIPFILKKNAHWEKCKLRVFTLANKKEELDRTHRNMASLLSKFRIDYSDVIVIPDVTKKPKKSSELEFSALLEDWKQDEEEDEKSNDPAALVVTETEILALKDKTNRHIRLREMLEEHSKDANLVIMTLPMPRKNAVSAPMYMAWLEFLTRNMPPFLFIRGNQTSVLTFYS